jgi:hypothetical protein
LQNKIDLITESAAVNQHETIQKFIQVGAQSWAGQQEWGSKQTWLLDQFLRSCLGFRTSQTFISLCITMMALVFPLRGSMKWSHECFCWPYLPLQGTIADGAPVVPVSAQLKYNIDVVCEYITKRIPVPKR